MNLTEDRKIPACFPGARKSGGNTRAVSMHPDDFAAHLAWITAKRCSELKEPCTEKPGNSPMGDIVFDF